MVRSGQSFESLAPSMMNKLQPIAGGMLTFGEPLHGEYGSMGLYTRSAGSTY